MSPLDRAIGFVTAHNVATIVLVLVLTAGMAVGIGSLETGGQASGEVEEFDHLETVDAAQYADERYGEETAVERSYVYVSAPDGNALSRTALLDSLRYQRAVRSDEAVGNALAPADPVRGVPNLIARTLADDPTADLEAQIAALEAADEEAVAAAIESTLTADSAALTLLPASYEPGTPTAEGHRMVFAFAAGEDAPPSDAQAVLYETASDRTDPAYFTLGEHAQRDANETFFANLVTLVVPIALLLLVSVLAITYRDPVDVIVGMVGTVVSLVWMFGILGWLGVEAGSVATIIGPVVVIAISVDFSFHVLMRYREYRGDEEPIEPPMARAMRTVAVALALVVLTAAIGFLSNLTNPISSVRALGIAITLGICSSFVIFLTLVPALKLTIDGPLERIGLDRRRAPLGSGAVLGRSLAGSVRVARRLPAVILVVALVAGAGGVVAWSALEHESVQEPSGEPDEWLQSLPGPLAWEVPETTERAAAVERQYAPAADDDLARGELLFRGPVAEDGALDAVAVATETADDRGAVAESAGSGAITSPLSVIETAAERDETVASLVAETDTDGDGVPDTDLDRVYDAVYEAAPDAASRVIERDGGEYRSMRVLVLTDGSLGVDRRADAMDDAARTADDEADALTVTPVGAASVNQAIIADVAGGVFRTLLLALGAIALVVTLSFRLANDSATLGILTVIPIALVTAFVFGGMYLLSVPVTLLTALLLSLVLGMGIDYSIHVSDRFLLELERGEPPAEALRTTVVGTGGALLGTTLTSIGAFAALLLVPHPQLRSLGLMVSLAMAAAFLASVIVLPSLLTLWERYVDYVGADADDARAPSGSESVAERTD